MGVLIVYQGDGTQSPVQLTMQLASGSVYDVATATEIEVRFPKTGGGFVAKTLTGGDVTLVNASAGIIAVAFVPADSAQFLLSTFNSKGVAVPQDFYAIVTISAEPQTVLFASSLTVLAEPF